MRLYHINTHMISILGCVQVSTLRLQRFAYGMHSPELGTHGHLQPTFVHFLQVSSVSFMTEDMSFQIESGMCRAYS